MFSTYAVQGIEPKTKGAYSREELAPLAQTNVESLKEFGFFTFAKADGKKEKFLEPVDYFLEHRDGALVLHFTLPFKAPVKTKQLALEIYDPSFFVDFSLQKQDPVKLMGAPASCTLAIERPNDGSAAAQKLNEQSFSSGENANYGNRVSSALQQRFGYGKPFVIDTSRNGNGSNGQWCNPSGRRIGTPTRLGGGAEMLPSSKASSPRVKSGWRQTRVIRCRPGGR